MAIQTRGFGVDVMPHYTPVDPGLVAFNPSALTNGVLEQFKVANEAEKLKAFQMQQDELNQLRQERIATAHAKLQNEAGQAQSETVLRGPTTQNALYGLETQSQLQPGARTLALTGQGFDIQQLPVKRQLESDILATNAAAQPDKSVATLNTAATEAAKSEGALGRVDTEQLTADQQAEIAQKNAEFEAATQGDTQEVKLAKIRDELQHASTDLDVKRLGALLENQVKQATVNQLNARAAYELGQGRQPAVRDKALGDVSLIERNINSELKRPLPNGMTVEEYRAAKAATPGIIGQGVDLARGALGLSTGFQGNAEGDAALETIQHLEDTKREILQDYVAARKAGKATATPPAKPITVSYIPAATAQPPAQTSGSIYDTPATESAPGEPPVMTPAQAAQLPPGTRFKTTDGRIFIKQ